MHWDRRNGFFNFYIFYVLFVPSRRVSDNVWLEYLLQPFRMLAKSSSIIIYSINNSNLNWEKGKKVYEESFLSSLLSIFHMSEYHMDQRTHYLTWDLVFMLWNNSSIIKIPSSNCHTCQFRILRFDTVIPFDFVIL